MIEVTINSEVTGQSPFKVKFSCPSCGILEEVYNLVPHRCLQCGAITPNIFAILYNRKAKIAWHKQKE